MNGNLVFSNKGKDADSQGTGTNVVRKALCLFRSTTEKPSLDEAQ